jgi:hypothetical protein
MKPSIVLFILSIAVSLCAADTHIVMSDRVYFDTSGGPGTRTAPSTDPNNPTFAASGLSIPSRARVTAVWYTIEAGNQFLGNVLTIATRNDPPSIGLAVKPGTNTSIVFHVIAAYED